MASPPSAADERRIPGGSIGLPLIDTLAAIHNHSASRNTWHSHRMFELLFLLEGSTAYEFADGRTVELAGGQFLVMLPSQVHRGLHEVRMPAILCGMVFDPRRANAGRNAPFTARDLDWMKRQFERTARVPQAMSPELKRMAFGLHRAVRRFPGAVSGENGAAAALRILACAAILESARQLTSSPPKEPKRAVESAIAHMKRSFHEPLPMAVVAERAGCGRARFYQLFKISTGMTPNDYLQRLRVKEASALLTGSGRSATEIALMAGFSSGQYFCNVFRKYTGVSPVAFRRRRAAS
jgi:AraC-like DNA-binding protein